MTAEDELEQNAYGCWCCGEIEGLTKTDINTDEVLCGECGEAGIITLLQCLSTLNALYEDGQFYPHHVNGHDPFSDDDTPDDDTEPTDEVEDDDENYNQ